MNVLENALADWEASARGAARPWEASPELRSSWLQMATGGSNQEEREVGVLMLARVSNQAPREQEAVFGFLSEGRGFSAVDENEARWLLITGGSPPAPFFLGNLLENGREELHRSPVLRMFASALLRNPGAVPAAEFLADRGFSPLVGGLHWHLNPALPFERIREIFSIPNPWVRAALYFHPAVALPAPLPPRLSRIEQVALALRPTLQRAEWEGAMEITEGIPRRLLREHPAGRLRRILPAGPIEWGNPRREVIDYFSEIPGLGPILRFWCPSLGLPWEIDDVTGLQEPEEVLGLLFCGAPAEFIARNPALDVEMVRALMDEHPENLLEAYLRNQK